ncbi:hypothetical protein B0H19DRAFT_1379988 [Mycena capillaripes]|nr:hypothetical protein B0H19DRAFT_1379988 [Mycena capillaripes]
MMRSHRSCAPASSHSPRRPKHSGWNTCLSYRRSAEQHAVIFLKVVQNWKCSAVDSNGKKCTGGPIMRAKPQGMSRGHQYFIGCSGYSTKFKVIDSKHRSLPISDHVDENIFARLLAGQSLADGDEKDTAPCSQFVKSGTGLKPKFCPHPHIEKGLQVRSRIVQHECDATRTIFVPLDTSIRKALIINNTTSNAPTGPAAGVVGATVVKVDNAASTKVILKGKSVTAFAPALQDKRVKADILRKVKSAHFPDGLDLAGAFKLYQNGLTKPLPERYIHSYLAKNDGSVCILTCVPYLLKLLDDPGVTSFDGDTTYKRIEGKMNEWEVTIFAKVSLRAVSVLRAYINRASTDFFEEIFDEVQRLKIQVTGKPVPLKRFIPGGNLLVMNSDMDTAQIMGITRSAMKYNVPTYSGIPNDTPPEKVAPEFVKICWRHAKEPVNDFRTLVRPPDFQRLQDFVYIDSKESLSEFSVFIDGIGEKKVQDWWRHKEMHEWIIPCLVKSQSPIPAEVWDSTPSTTNTNEAQHAWTNAQTGIKLSLVEGLETAYKTDTTAANEIDMSMRTGIFPNANNEVVHREARNSQRRSARAQKARETDKVADEAAEIKAQLAALQETRRDSNAQTKELNQKLKALTGKSGARSSKGKAPAILTASSSGRVKTMAHKDLPARKLATSFENLPTEGSLLGDSTLPDTNLDKTATTAGDHPQMLSMQSASSAAGVTLFTNPVPEQLMAANFGFPQAAAQSGADFWSVNDFDWAAFMDRGNVMSPGAFPGDALTPDFMSPFDFDSFPGSYSSLNALMPALVPTDYSARPAAVAISFVESTLGSTSVPSSKYSQWPTLPPVQPDSPSEASVAIDDTCAPSTSAANKKRRQRQEVDPANILESNSVRSRNPSERSRAGAEGTSERPIKRAKASK